MAGSAAVYGGGDAPKRTQKLHQFDQPLDSIAPESTLGSRRMLNFGAASGVKRSGNLVFSSYDQDEFGEEYLDEYLNQQEKKRRLTVEQVQFLEKSFEADNKLEPERKIQLANELGLQPRQIAVWFQNRRARYKTKRVETDYETLHANYETLKTDYDSLLKENDKLKAEVLRLKENSLDSRGLQEVMPREANTRVISEDEESNVSALAFKNEEQSSAKSEMSNGIQSPLLDLGVTSHAFHLDYSDSSQNGEENLHEELLQPNYAFPRIEDAHNHPQSSFYYGFPVEDHAFNFW